MRKKKSKAIQNQADKQAETVKIYNYDAKDSPSILNKEITELDKKVDLDSLMQINTKVSLNLTNLIMLLLFLSEVETDLGDIKNDQNNYKSKLNEIKTEGLKKDWGS